MAGFLDPKQRIMDAILTEIGRLQMVKGEFDVKFVSFSDAGVDYSDDGNGVLEPITERLFFEPFSKSSDEIIPEIDSLGKFIIDQELPDNDLEVHNGNVISTSSGSSDYVVVDGYSNVTSFTSNTKDRFKSLEILNTESSIAEFECSPATFTVLTGSVSTLVASDSNGILPLSIDPRFENQLNMKYLPPVMTRNGKTVPVKAFNKWTSTEDDVSESEKLESKLEEIASAMNSMGGDSNLTSTRFTLGPMGTDDYKSYNILGQIFTSKDQSLKKYTIIDAGEYFDVDNIPVCRIYFVGFVLKNNSGITKFQREFSLVFHSGAISQTGGINE